MTVYVDDFRAPAIIGRIRGRWSHLTADTPAELHTFADLLGHRREWFQGRCTHTNCPTMGGVCVHYHYDVVDSRRAAAIELGATPIGIRDMGALIAVRRRQFIPDPGLDAPTPCQPIGCDHGIHLYGCCYATGDQELPMPEPQLDAPPGPAARRPRRVRVTGDLYHPAVPNGAVYVGRQAPGLRRSEFANPFKAGRTAGSRDRAVFVRDSAHAVALYEAMVVVSGRLQARIREELAGRDLACWCRPDAPCHADVLLRWANHPEETPQ